MNYGIILAAGVGQRMRNDGLPKQFLKLMGKPIIIYTLEKFEECQEINELVIVCHSSYIDYMKKLIDLYQIKKVKSIISGGDNRQSSLRKGLYEIRGIGGKDEDVVVIHDGVRPLVDTSTIRENIRIAERDGAAMTVRMVTESVVVTNSSKVGIDNFKERANTYSLTSPQTFMIGKLLKVYSEISNMEEEIPLLDAAMVYAKAGNKIELVKEQGTNLKITTPEDYYFFKAILELEESKFIFGL